MIFSFIKNYDDFYLFVPVELKDASGLKLINFKENFIISNYFESFRQSILNKYFEKKRKLLRKVKRIRKKHNIEYKKPKSNQDTP